MLHVDNSGDGMQHSQNTNLKTIRMGAFTDKGKMREINEDNYFICGFDNEYENETGYIIIADGMGGHNAGEVASQIAIDEIRQYISQRYHQAISDEEIQNMMHESFVKANTVIFNSSNENEQCTGMGTTAILCVIKSHKLYIAHVGDSRVYIIRNKKINQITIDHSIVEELVNSGTITREEAENHPQKNVITRALGAEEQTEIDVDFHSLEDKDILLLCTDGLTNMLTNEEILSEFSKDENLQLTIEKLVKLANDKGGLDNITAIALKLQY